MDNVRICLSSGAKATAEQKRNDIFTAKRRPRFPEYILAALRKLCFKYRKSTENQPFVSLFK